MTPPRVVVVLLTVIVVASSLAVEGSSRSTPAASTSVHSAALSTDIAPVPVGATTAPLAGTAEVLVTLTLASPQPAREAALLSAVEDPTSSGYHHFLSPAQYLVEFAPTTLESAAVQATLEAYGGRSVTVFPDRTAVSALLTPVEVHALFGINLVEYGRSGGLPLYTAEGSLSLPARIASLVVGVSGLSDERDAQFTLNLAASAPRPLSRSSSPGTFVYDSPNATDWAVGSDYTDVFGATELFPGPESITGAVYPQKVAIATLLASGYNETAGENLPPWDPAVVDSYFNETLPSQWPAPRVSGFPVPIGGVSAPLPGSFGALNDSTLDEFENSLDLEMAGSMAPGARIVNFYLPGSLFVNPPAYSNLADDFSEALSDALSYNYSPARLAVVSASFGLPDLNDSAWNLELEEAALTGVTVVAASGDQGNAPDSLTDRDDGQWPIWPASAAFEDAGALSVGGVSLSFRGTPTAVYNGSPTLNLEYDANITAMTNVSAWYDDSGSALVAGTEGGASLVIPEPYWQVHSAAQPAIVNATEREPATMLGRAGPDVALSGNRTIATVLANATGVVFFAELEGTSIAAPLMAGLVADVVGVESNGSSTGWAPLGFVDPEIYRIASYYEAFPSNVTDPFTAVTSGGNYVFSAGPGWDPLTGWGTVSALWLLEANENPTVSGYAYTGPTPGLPGASHSAPGPPIPWTAIYLLFGLGISAAVVILILSARPRPPEGTPTVPYGAREGLGPGAQGGLYTGATFLCPYCGAVRPAEPGRCPQCGAF